MLHLSKMLLCALVLVGTCASGACAGSAPALVVVSACCESKAPATAPVKGGE